MVSDTAGVEAGDSELLQTIRLRIPARPEYVALCRLAMTGLAGVVLALGVIGFTRADVQRGQ